MRVLKLMICAGLVSISGLSAISANAMAAPALVGISVRQSPVPENLLLVIDKTTLSQNFKFDPKTALACEGQCIIGILNAFTGEYTQPIK